MGETLREIRIAIHIGMRFTSAAIFLLLFVNLYVMGDSNAFMALESFAYGAAFGLFWYVPIPPEAANSQSQIEEPERSAGDEVSQHKKALPDTPSLKEQGEQGE